MALECSNKQILFFDYW